jgi:hypothetical protein
MVLTAAFWTRYSNRKKFADKCGKLETILEK